MLAREAARLRGRSRASEWRSCGRTFLGVREGRARPQQRSRKLRAFQFCKQRAALDGIAYVAAKPGYRPLTRGLTSTLFAETLP